MSTRIIEGLFPLAALLQTEIVRGDQVNPREALGVVEVVQVEVGDFRRKQKCIRNCASALRQ